MVCPGLGARGRLLWFPFFDLELVAVESKDALEVRSMVGSGLGVSCSISVESEVLLGALALARRADSRRLLPFPSLRTHTFLIHENFNFTTKTTSTSNYLKLPLLAIPPFFTPSVVDFFPLHYDDMFRLHSWLHWFDILSTRTLLLVDIFPT